MTELARRHRKLNLETADKWATFAEHRERVTGLLLDGEPGRRLGVLGAGNCNDLDLVELCKVYHEITLVDIDETGLSRAVQKQPMSVRELLATRAPVDIGGLTSVLAGSASAPQPRAAAQEIASEITDRPFDVVLSASTLSQIILAIADQFGARDPRCIELVQFARAVHIHLMIALLSPRGRAVLISDMVSSDTVPGLFAARRESLRSLMLQLVARSNFFTGINPFLIEHTLKQDPTFAALVSDVVLHDPWVWRIAPSRGYLTFAISFTRNPTSE